MNSLLDVSSSKINDFVPYKKSEYIWASGQTRPPLSALIGQGQESNDTPKFGGPPQTFLGINEGAKKTSKKVSTNQSVTNVGKPFAGTYVSWAT